MRRVSSVGAGLGLGLAVLVVAGCSQDVTRPDAPGFTPPAALAAVPGGGGDALDLLVQVREDASEGQRRALEAILQRYEVSQSRSLVAGQVGVYRVANRGARGGAQIAAEIEATGAVEFAEVDAVVPHASGSGAAALLTANDPLYPTQWHHGRIGSEAAWDVTTGSPSVLATVCDTGIELTHPDLAANITSPGRNLLTYEEDGSNARPNLSHGTKVAGTLGAVGNNLEGVAGVSWAVDILSILVDDGSTSGAQLSKLVECVDSARVRGAKVVNVSYVAATRSALNAAGEALMAAGGLLFVAAGNNNQKLTGKNHPGIIAVGGTDEDDAKTDFSNYGTHLDLMAPAVRIVTTLATTHNPDHPPYTTDAWGTSYATPIVAGVAALIWAARPDLSPATVQNILFTTARDLGAPGYDQTFGHGRVDAAAALAAALDATDPSPENGGGGGKGGGKGGGGGPKK